MRRASWGVLIACGAVASASYALADAPEVPTTTDSQELATSLVNAYTNTADAALYPPGTNSYLLTLGVIAFDETGFEDWLTNGWYSIGEDGFDFYPVTLTETGTAPRGFTIEDGAQSLLMEPATPAGFDPQVWAEEVYGEPPAWLDSGELADWYTDRDANRQRVTARLLPLAQRDDWIDYQSNTYAEASAGTNAVFVLPLDTNLLAFAATLESAGGWQPWVYVPGSVGWIDLYGSETLAWPWTLIGAFVPQYVLEGIDLGTAGIARGHVLASDGAIDTDGDGLADGREILVYGTDPGIWDSDADELSDGEEILTYGLDALSADSDGDGLTDGFEVAGGLDPTDSTGGNGAAGDPDGDGLSNEEEQTLGTDPDVADTIVGLGDSDVAIDVKTRTAQRSKFTGYPSFVAANPPAYYLRLERAEQSHNLTASATTNGCENQFLADSVYTLTQSVDAGTMELAGAARHVRIEGYWALEDWLLTAPTSTQQITWAHSQGTYVTFDLSPAGGSTSTLCGAGFSTGSPPEYHHGQYTLPWLSSKYPNATKTPTTLSEDWTADVGCNVATQSVSWKLSELYTANLLNQYTAGDLGEMAATAPWNGILWSTNITHDVGADLCVDPTLGTNALNGPVQSSRALAADQIQLALAEAKFRFEVPTQQDVVHQIAWVEHFEPDAATNPGGSNQVLHAASVQFLGDGTTQYVGRAEDDGPNPAYPYATLVGNGKDDDFAIPAPPQSLGNGIVKLYVIKVEIVDAAGNSTDELAISKWPGAFYGSGPDPAFTNAFIESDPDRFRLRVANLPTGVPSVPVYLSTDHADSALWDDGETEITCTQDPSGTYTSKTMILVSNDIDDDEIHTNSVGHLSGAADNAADDRTHIARLGSIVKARLSLGAVDISATAIVPKPKKVFVTVKILKDGNGDDAVDKDRVDAMLVVARELYAQVGIEVEWNTNSLTIASNPAGVDLSDGIAIMGDVTDPKGVTPETKALIDGLGTPGRNDDIHVFFVEPPFQSAIYGATNEATGIALNDSVPSHVDTLYRFNAFVIDEPNVEPEGELTSIFTLAHELGHLLDIADHAPSSEQWRLMYKTDRYSDDINNTKRFDNNDETNVNASTRVHATQ